MNSSANLQIEQFDPLTASAAEFAALYSLETELLFERNPEQHPDGLEGFIVDQQRVWPGSKNWEWIAWQGTKAAGRASLEISTTDANADSAQFSIAVQLDLRCKGLGRQVLHLVTAVAEETGQRELVTWSSSLVPAATAFVKRIGGHVAVEHRDSALDIDSLDRRLVTDWLARGESLSGDYEIVLNVGPWPEAGLEHVCRMYEIMNTAPHEIIRDPEPTTPKEIRLRESFQAVALVERWTMYVRPRGSQTIAGYTEVYWKPGAPHHLDQGDTGVAPDHRGKGLAIWLKAAMLDKVLRERPSVRRITTGNATVNLPMLSINERLGFRYTHSAFMWQIPLEAVQQYLAGGEIRDLH